MTARQMIDQGKERAKQVKTLTQASPLRYVVKLRSGFYARANRHWTPMTTDALKFEFMTIATAHAIMELGLSSHEFDIEVVRA